jgi:hypothetical protein
MNLAILAPLVAIVASPWRYAAGIVPSYWIGEMLGVSDAAYLAPPAVVAIAGAIHAAVLAWAVRRYSRVGG